MNLDTLTNCEKIRKAVNTVKLSEIGGSWLLLGYVDKGEASRLMTIDVTAEGTAWADLVNSLKDDRIQYGYAKLVFEDSTKLFLIHWVGKDVDEDKKTNCMPHFNEVRNLIPAYDLLVNSMDCLDVQAKVQGFLCRKQSISVDESKPRIRKSSVSEDSSFDIPRRPLLSHGMPQQPEQQESPKQKFKVAIIGRSGVGKTSIYLSYKGGGSALSDPQGIASTVSADNMSKDVTLDNHTFILEIWDTAGQEEFVEFAPVWLRFAKVVICVYDLTDKQSYTEIPRHIQTAKEYADPRVVFFLVGNKADLGHRREVQEADAKSFATQYNMTFMECSGLTGLNILKLFESITRQVVFTYQDMFTTASGTTAATVQRDQNIQLRVGSGIQDNSQGSGRSCMSCK